MKLFVLLSLKNKTSADCEGYNIYLNNIINPAVCTYLARLFNRCLQGQYFPWILKFALVSRLFKSGKKDNSGNYRSVSLLPVISKELEKPICSRVKNFILSQKFFKANQFCITIKKINSWSSFGCYRDYLEKFISQRRCRMYLYWFVQSNWYRWSFNSSWKMLSIWR